MFLKLNCKSLQLDNAPRSRGLELNLDKTTNMSNATKKTGRRKDKFVKVGGMNIEMLPFDGSLRYFGRQLSFDRPQQVEIDNRLKAAWKKTSHVQTRIDEQKILFKR